MEIIYILVYAIIFCAFFIRSLTGFGSALIVIPTLSIFLDIKSVVPAVIIFEVAVSTVLLKNSRDRINFKSIKPLLAGAIIGTIIGSYFLATYNTPVLKKMLAAAMFLYALKMMSSENKRTTTEGNYRKGLLFGFIGGGLGGMTGINGPPFVMYLSHILPDKEELRSTIIAIITLDYMTKLPFYLYLGLIDTFVLKLTLIGLPAVAIGIYYGSKARININEIFFRKIVGAVLLLLSLLLLIT